MSDAPLLLAVALGALALGALIAALVTRGLARAGARAELATAAERLRGRDEQLAQLRSELESLRNRADDYTRRASDLQAKLAEADTRLEEERQQSAEKLALLTDAEKKLADSFAHLSQQALAANNDSFLALARQTFETLHATAQGDLEGRRQAIEGLVAPIKEKLGEYELGIRELENARKLAYGGLAEQVRGLAQSQESLLRETGKLVTALRRPEVRGNWGEVQLRRVVEFAGMVEHVDFLPQETIETEEGRLRPDLLVRLPGDKKVVVDAKAPLDAYLAAIEATDDETRRVALVRHARQVRTHLGKLAGKEYWKQFEEAPDFVVLFLPGDAYFSAALEYDPTLIEDSFRQNVLVATPATLVALLKTVHYGWRQESLAANAREISDAARDLYDRIRVFIEHFGRVGKGLDDAVKNYNAAVGSFETKVLPQGRRIERLGAGSAKPIQSLEAIETLRREPAALVPGERNDD